MNDLLLSNSAQLIKDINLDGVGSNPAELVEIGGTVYFRANDSVHGEELWKSDGTDTGTVLVKDINPGTDTGYPPRYLTNVNGTLFFSARDDGAHNFELWKSDGTATGTVLVKDIDPGSESSIPHFLTNVNGTLFFSADDGVTGRELWKLNNTPVGNNVVVQAVDSTTGTAPATLTFSQVTQAGTTSLSTSTAGPAPPSGFALGDPPTHYELASTAVFSGSVIVCINYTAVSFGDESALKLFHFENGDWVDTTTSLDTTNDIICGSVTSLSPFAILEAVNVAPVPTFTGPTSGLLIESRWQRTTGK